MIFRNTSDSQASSDAAATRGVRHQRDLSGNSHHVKVCYAIGRVRSCRLVTTPERWHGSARLVLAQIQELQRTAEIQEQKMWKCAFAAVFEQQYPLVDSQWTKCHPISLLHFSESDWWNLLLWKLAFHDVINGTVISLFVPSSQVSGSTPSPEQVCLSFLNTISLNGIWCAQIIKRFLC